MLETIYVVNKKFFKKNPRFIIKSGFKSRAGYNGACTVFGYLYIIRLSYPYFNLLYTSLHKLLLYNIKM
jgi:hypothetical protein